MLLQGNPLIHQIHDSANSRNGSSLRASRTPLVVCLKMQCFVDCIIRLDVVGNYPQSLDESRELIPFEHGRISLLTGY